MAPMRTASFSTSASFHAPFHQRPSGWPTCTSHASGFRLASNMNASSRSRSSLGAGAELTPGDAAAGTSWARACSGASAARGESFSFLLLEEAMTDATTEEGEETSIHKKKRKEGMENVTEKEIRNARSVLRARAFEHAAGTITIGLREIARKTVRAASPVSRAPCTVPESGRDRQRTSK
jgi:hypothetical protein